MWEEWKSFGGKYKSNKRKLVSNWESRCTAPPGSVQGWNPQSHGCEEDIHDKQINS